MKTNSQLRTVYWFTFYNLNSPTVRYRGKFTTDHLKKEYGIAARFIMPGRDLLSIGRFLNVYLKALLFPGKGSLIVIQSVYTRSFYARALKLLVKCRKSICFYDLDDADYLRYPPESIYYFLKNCSAVTLGSTELVKNLSKYNPNTTWNPCPVPDLGIVKQKKNELLTIGWIGDFTKGHKQSLMETFFPALNDLPFRVKLVLMGVDRKEEYEFLREYFSKARNITVEIPQGLDWQNEVAIQQMISNFDVGIATLIDDEFYRSKSAFKLKQCFNNGVPVLSTNLPENNVFLEHGKNGYFCDTPEEFRQRIIEFNEMGAEKYAVFSAHARSFIHKFDLDFFCDTLITAYEKNN